MCSHESKKLLEKVEKLRDAEHSGGYVVKRDSLEKSE